MIRIFPIAIEGHPHFTDDFGVISQKSGKPHEGIDIFALYGAAIVAADNGTVRFTTDPIGGRAFYLTSATDGTVYYGAHLSNWHGGTRIVKAGDVIGYVGTDGNAAGTSPHCHFEKHPGGLAAADPYDDLLSAPKISVVSLRQILGVVAGAAALSALIFVAVNPSVLRRVLA
jgi:murein DD-endopeptidase MepM/ murein hydrolase activator NlpD